MPTVTMLVATISSTFGSLTEGQTVEVDEATAEQWESHHIAVRGEGAADEPETAADENSAAPEAPTTGESAREVLASPTQQRTTRRRR